MIVDQNPSDPIILDIYSLLPLVFTMYSKLLNLGALAYHLTSIFPLKCINIGSNKFSYVKESNQMMCCKQFIYLN